MAQHMALAIVGAVLLVLVTLGSVVALAPGRRRPRALLVLVPLVPLLLVLSGNGVPHGHDDAQRPPCLVTVSDRGHPARGGLALLRGMALDAARTAALALSAASTGLFALHWHCTDGSASTSWPTTHCPGWRSASRHPLRRALPTESHVP
jgi:hypothetical protein